MFFVIDFHEWIAASYLFQNSRVRFTGDDFFLSRMETIQLNKFLLMILEQQILEILFHCLNWIWRDLVFCFLLAICDICNFITDSVLPHPLQGIYLRG